MRGLFRVADREDHGVHADYREAVVRWRAHTASMRTGLKLRNQLLFG
jgi:hypothetical protein